jgi:dephospho-CoA kinase
MIKVGITGGIGSGKTTVCKQFEAKGIPVYYADDRAKKLMTSDKKVKAAIIDLFSKDAFFSNGRLNRKYISSQIFQNKELLAKLNSIVHPAVKMDGEKWFAMQTTHFAIKEAALLIEAGSFKELDKIIVVTCPEEIRINRVMKRDSASRVDVERRIKAQMPEAEKVKYADYVIVNDGVIDLNSQIEKVYQSLMSL